MRLLNIESSRRGSRSASIAVSSAFLEAYRQTCPGVTVDTLNVWEEKLPDFDHEAIGAKYKGINKEPMDQAEAAVWDKIQELAARFQQADRIVLGVPMWNFAYPYKLKQLTWLSLTKTGQSSDGETILREAVKMRTDSVPKGHFWIALANGALGECLTAQLRYDEAEPLLLESYKSLKSSQGATNPRTRLALRRLIALYNAWGKPDTADQYQSKLDREKF